jgi:hypothetical protein
MCANLAAKIWPRGQFPMQEVGVLTLNRNPEGEFTFQRPTYCWGYALIVDAFL